MQLQAIVLLCHENIPQGGELRGDLEDNSLLLVILLLEFPLKFPPGLIWTQLASTIVLHRRPCFKVMKNV